MPAPIRRRDRVLGFGEPVLPRYERIAFEKPLIAPPGQPLAAFVCPGHPLLDAVMDMTLRRMARSRCSPIWSCSTIRSPPPARVEEPENQLYPALLRELAEEFRDYARRDGRVLVSTEWDVAAPSSAPPNAAS